MIIYAFAFLGLSIGFFASTLMRHKKLRYNYWVGMCFMLVGVLIGIKAVDELYLTKPISFYRFIRLFGCYVAILVYVALNAYLIVNFRTNKY